MAAEKMLDEFTLAEVPVMVEELGGELTILAIGGTGECATVGYNGTSKGYPPSPSASL